HHPTVQSQSTQDQPPRYATEAAHTHTPPRAFVRRLTPFMNKVSTQNFNLRHIVLAVFKLFETFNVSKRLAEWMQEAHDQKRFEQRDEHAQVWTHLVDLLDQMVALMGDEPATLAD